jgi:hypothetical protein
MHQSINLKTQISQKSTYSSEASNPQISQNHQKLETKLSRK